MYYLFVLLVAAGLGLIPASIAKSKGYSFGLWWLYGWMLFIVAIIHVSLIPDKSTQSTSTYTYTPMYPSASTASSSVKRDAQKALPGEWKCTCGRVNSDIVSVCACGKNKRALEAEQAAPTPPKVLIEEKKAPEVNALDTLTTDAKSVAAQITEYKVLLDNGIITQEEFDAKKKQLLGI